VRHGILRTPLAAPEKVTSMPATSAAPDMSLRELALWAEGQARRLASNFGLDSSAERDNAYFALTQSVKLGEEVGELHAEVLGALKYQRKEKAGRYSSATLGGELADVMVCLALLAHTFNVDLAGAVSSKVEHLEARNHQAGLTA
jgi:NTP pyrophosphatase (non-canonical NTP hydrolase)